MHGDLFQNKIITFMEPYGKNCSSRSKNINVMTDSSDIDNEYFGTVSRSKSTYKFKVN